MAPQITEPKEKCVQLACRLNLINLKGFTKDHTHNPSSLNNTGICITMQRICLKTN